MLPKRTYVIILLSMALCICGEILYVQNIRENTVSYINV